MTNGLSATKPYMWASVRRETSDGDLRKDAIFACTSAGKEANRGKGNGVSPPREIGKQSKIHLSAAAPHSDPGRG